ncbi:penicillin-insensitive murein endopeptidase [Amylibacter kogurei]|uniref:Penicillin-insensitive murein endopeptidase n=1 Tax=Paramylibacter kogurei TaxID=1889778 RepID=A0A2G5KCD9_9RHOB|nr:penicillin-insensitive murein endopeptidase [Amylibacter kogurei]
MSWFVSLVAVAISVGLSSQVHAQPKANQLLGAKSKASLQTPQAHGFYSKGCVAGAEQLAQTGPTWQAMRLSRNRNWGHPDMIAYLKRVSAKVAQLSDWKGLYIGDISQPRGGPMTSGHASHQMGLDADIWMYPPKRLNLSRSERESLSSISVRSKDQRSVSKNWRESHMQVMKIAASDPAVDRIFVTAPVKIWMCNRAKGNKDWLQKIRPFWGHHYHFHVRLKCPKGSTNCKTQTPTVAQLSKGGNGCDETLNWWVTDALKPADPNAPKPPKRRHPREYTMADLPQQCTGVLKSR